MWKCHKCGKPVYFAERKVSLGYDWHPECLRCEECGKRLNPGQHAEHKGIPYCHVPCYGALFGPQLFGHGSTVESHKSFGQNGHRDGKGHQCHIPSVPRDQLDSKLKQYNQFFDNRSMEIKSREVNGRLVLEGALRVYWGVQGVIHLKEDDDQRTVVTVRKRNSCRYPNPVDVSDEMKEPLLNSHANNHSNDPMTSSMTSENGHDLSNADSTTCESCSWSEDAVVRNGNSDDYEDGSTSKEISPVHNMNNGSNKSITLPSKLDVKQLSADDWDEVDDLLQVERKVEESDKLYQTMPSPLPSSISQTLTTTDSSSSSSEYKTAAASSDKTLTAYDYTPDSLNTKNESQTNLISEDTTSTLKPEDFEEFKSRVQKEFITNANELRTSNDGTLKANQPIDPSRINDSLKLYSENILSKSFNGVLNSPNHSQYEIEFENALKQYETMHHVMENDEKIKFSRRQRGLRPGIQKSESSSTCNKTSSSSSSDTLIGGSITKSKSGPNCFESVHRHQNYSDDDDDLDDEATLRPSTIKRKEQQSISIKMDCYDELSNSNTTTVGYENEDGVVLRKPPKTGSTAIKRRSGNRRSRTKLKRRCSINGHFYNRETSFFTPPHGSMMSVWATSLVDTKEIINLLLEKYKVDSRAENFALFIVRDNGEQRKVKEDDYPLIVRVMLGPHEDVARLFLVDSHFTPEISSEVAQFINLSISECRAILDQYQTEQEREEDRIREKYAEMKRRIVQRMESLKVRL